MKQNPVGHTRLTPLWIWLFFATFGSFLSHPTDPISMYLALAYGLLSFLSGASLGSSMSMSGRFAAAILWITPAIQMATYGWNASLAPLAWAYGAASVAMGFWASRVITTGRLRIISCFAIGYVVETFVGPVGSMGGAVLGVILAKRFGNRFAETLCPADSLAARDAREPSIGARKRCQVRMALKAWKWLSPND